MLQDLVIVEIKSMKFFIRVIIDFKTILRKIQYVYECASLLT